MNMQIGTTLVLLVLLNTTPALARLHQLGLIFLIFGGWERGKALFCWDRFSESGCSADQASCTV